MFFAAHTNFATRQAYPGYIEFQGDGLVALYGVNEWIAYKTDLRIIATLKELEKEQSQFLVRRVRAAPSGVFIVIFGDHGFRSLGLDVNLSRKLLDPINGPSETTPRRPSPFFWLWASLRESCYG
jgi:hypothetical protein